MRSRPPRRPLFERLLAYALAAALLAATTPCAWAADYTIAAGSTVPWSANLASSDTLTNAGTLIFSGTPTFDGTLTNNATGVIVNNASLLTVAHDAANNGNLTNNGGLWNTQTFYTYGTFTNAGAGVITNSGSLYNSGGAFTNNGTINTSNKLYNQSGGTFLNNGTINNSGLIWNFGSCSFQNAGTIANTSQLWNSGTFTNNGTITNESAFTNRSTGTFLNGGTFTSNGTITNAGVFSDYGTLTNTGTATSSGTFNVMENATFSNSGSLTNSGTFLDYGALTNTGTASNSNIFTIMSGGTLDNSGSFANTGTLSSYGTLNNTGSITGSGAVAIKSGGVLNNYATGSITGTGSLYAYSGSTLALAVGSTINVSNLYLSSGATYTSLGSVSGTVTLYGLVHLLDATDNASTATTLTKTSTSGLYSITFTAINGDSSATLTYTANSLGSAAGGNAGALDSARLGATSGSTLASIFNTLYAASDAAQVQSGVQQLAGEGVINTPQLIGGQMAAFRSAVGQQQGRFSGGTGGSGFTASGGMWSSLGNSAAAGDASLGDNGLMATLAQIMVMNANDSGKYSSALSARGQVQTLHQGARSGLSGYNGELGVAALGYDTPVAEDLRLGAAFGYSGGQLRGAGATTNLHTWFGSLYGTWNPGPVQLDGDLTYAYTSGTVNGEYTWPVADSTTGSYTANTYSGSIKASRAFSPFGEDGPRVTPSLAVEAARSDRDAFTESGSTLYRRFGASTMNTLDVPVGAAVSKDFDYAGGTVSPEISAYYVRRLEDTRSSGRVTLMDSTATSTVDGASTGRNLWRANAGARFATSGHIDFSLFYNGEFGQSYSNNGLTLEIKYSF